jgi:hypothetical protein
MIRSFHLRDVGLVHRLGEQGVILQTQAALTRISHPTRQAMIHMFGGGSFTTYVWKSDDREAVGFAQLNLDPSNTTAHLSCIGAQGERTSEGHINEVDEDIWLSLLADLAREAGRRGVHNLVAEADENGSELSLLRRAGYAIYTRQDIWICDQSPESNSDNLLRSRQTVDDWDISVLYSNIVPGLIQSVEPAPPLFSGEDWVLREDGELSAFVHILSGPVASWMRLLIHPNAHTKPRIIISEALGLKSPTSEHPIYCCVRRYQSWLQAPLEEAGFRYWGSQAVLVKHMALRAEKHAPVKHPVLETQAVAGGSSPIIHKLAVRNGQKDI